MSNLTTLAQFICAFFPKKSAAANGAVAITITVEAKNAKLAEMKATMALEETFPDTSDNFFKPKISEYIIGDSGRPAIGEFDTEWIKNYAWNEETKKFDLIPLEEMPDQLDPMENIKVISDLDVAERVAYISMYGAEPLEIDMEQLSNAIDMVSDDEAPEDMKALIHGLAGVPALKQMLPARLAVMIETMRAQMPPFDSAEDVRKFADKWVAEPAKREELAKPAADIPRTYDALDLEVALHVMGINPDLAKAADIRNAKDLIQKRDPAWRAWATSLRVITGILRVPRGELWTLMEDGHKNLKLIEDADARRDYVSSKLHGHPLLPDYQPETSQVKNLGDGKFSIEGLTGGATSNDGEKKEVAVEATCTSIGETQAKTGTKPAQTDTETTKPASEIVKNAPKPEIAAPVADEATPSQPMPDDFKTRAEILEKELAAKTGDAATNLGIWKRVQRTDPARTKQQNTTNAKGEVTRTVTSIRPTYQYMRATELFGPFGLGWGVDVVEERFDRGIPMMEPVLDNTGREIAKKVMRDGDGTIMATQNHTMRIVLWYILDGKRGEITAYGHTKAVYASKYGFTVEEEPSKKSLTDATTKALSSLGFSADVYLGLFDDADYTADNAYEHNLKNASEKAEDEVRLRKELDERFAKNTDTMRGAVSASEVTKIASSLTRTIGSEIKAAKRANDTGHVSYLESRLKRLEEIKTECLAKFEGEKA